MIKNILIYGFFALLACLQGCTPLQPMGLDLDLAIGCPDVDCIIDRVNEAEPKAGERYKWMEGYDDVDLRYMRDHGLLTVKLINPLLVIPWGIFGLAEVHWGKYGDVAKCDVQYTPSPASRILVHELSHCKGYADRFFGAYRGDYTKAQKEIMAKEGKESWVDTDFYKLGKYWVEYNLEDNEYNRKLFKEIQ